MNCTGVSSTGIIQDSPDYARYLAKPRKEVHEIELWQEKVTAHQIPVNWICETTDQFFCDTPAKDEPSADRCTSCAETMDVSVDLALSKLPDEKSDDVQRAESMHAVSFSLDKLELSTSQPERSELIETFQIAASHSTTCSDKEVGRYSSIEGDNKQCSQQTPLIHRRLVFEVSGSRYRKLVSDSFGPSSTAEQPASAEPSNSSMSVRGKSSFPLPGIGLHLNALTVAPSDDVIVKQEPVPSKKKPVRKLSTKPSSESTAEKAFVEAVSRETQELNQGSPKKRRRSESTGETEGCKRCNCRRSKCLKLYCECFAAGLYCVEPCSCQGCFNQPAHEQTVMDTRTQIESRNPLAFAPKVIKISDYQDIGGELNKTPASARHKRGCNCRKSSCLKKYCECFQGGVGCSVSCRCEGCKNTFGCKEWPDGIMLEETRPVEEIAAEANIQNEVPKVENVYEQHDIERGPHLQVDRTSTHFAPCFTGISKEPPSFGRKTPSLQPCPSTKVEESDFHSYEPKPATPLQMIPEDETQETLTDDGSHLNGVNSVSPNSKRVSPPYRESGTSSTFRSTRKLILKSIPMFPVLSPNKDDA